MLPPNSPSLPLPMAGEGARVRLVHTSGSSRAAHRLTGLCLPPGV